MGKPSHRSVLLAALAAGGCQLTVGQQTFLPARPAALPVMAADVTRSNIELAVAPGLVLRGWHLRKPGSRRVALFFHGNGAGILSSDWALHWLAVELDADVVAFDHRGYGFSDGPPSIDPIVEDSVRVHAFVRERLGLGERPMVVIGQSMGTAPAIHLAARAHVAALILISPFSSHEDLVAAVGRTTPWYVHVTEDPSLTRLRTRPLLDLPQVRAPTLIVHGTRDVLATPEVVRRVAQALVAARPLVCDFDGTHDQANPQMSLPRSRGQSHYAAIAAICDLNSNSIGLTNPRNECLLAGL